LECARNELLGAHFEREEARNAAIDWSCDHGAPTLLLGPRRNRAAIRYGASNMNSFLRLISCAFAGIFVSSCVQKSASCRARLRTRRRDPHERRGAPGVAPNATSKTITVIQPALSNQDNAFELLAFTIFVIAPAAPEKDTIAAVHQLIGTFPRIIAGANKTATTIAPSAIKSSVSMWKVLL
jgi:hypothetical protein